MTIHNENVRDKQDRHSQADLEWRELQEKENLIDPLRLGRRESEPHSAEVSYLYDVLSTNFPEHRTMWDLHHYFSLVNEKVDLQFDISFFLNFNLDEDIPSYNALDYQGRVPDLVINVLSKSTWQKDLSNVLEHCRALRIKRYIIFLAYPIAPRLFHTPFARYYSLNSHNSYTSIELEEFTMINDEFTNPNAIIRLDPEIPFDIGLERLQRTYIGNKARTRLILIQKGGTQKLLSDSEKEKRRADEEKRRADEEKRRADEEKRRADEEKRRADDLEEKLRNIIKNHPQ